jgi:alkanesulfonate monooxygenase SsuD/methylene tetrahydromethanopterin reductase-like flavin-dependent oxidoreductase (luciferase family)
VDVGVAMTFQSHYSGLSDYQVYKNEVDLALQAEPLGFDSVWSTEHHFNGYEMVPSPVQFLTYVAGATKRVRLGTMVIVVPWHDPYRIAAEVAMLDNLSDGRMILGLGRGLARSEFERFRVPREESRTRFNEHSAAILKSLETGTFELDGTYITQIPSDIRPEPFGTFKGRSFIAGNSPESMPIAAELGVGMILVPTSTMSGTIDKLRVYEDEWIKHRPDEPIPQPKLGVHGYVDRDAGRAEALAHEHIGNFVRASNVHYELGGAGPTIAVSGYDHYRAQEELVRDNADQFVRDFVNDMLWGTPDQVIEKAESLRDRIDMSTLMIHFSYAGLPHADAVKSMRLFADEVLPVLHGWKTKSRVSEYA